LKYSNENFFSRNMMSKAWRNRTSWRPYACAATAPRNTCTTCWVPSSIKTLSDVLKREKGTRSPRLPAFSVIRWTIRRHGGNGDVRTHWKTWVTLSTLLSGNLVVNAWSSNISMKDSSSILFISLYAVVSEFADEDAIVDVVAVDLRTVDSSCR